MYAFVCSQSAVDAIRSLSARGAWGGDPAWPESPRALPLWGDCVCSQRSFAEFTRENDPRCSRASFHRSICWSRRAASGAPVNQPSFTFGVAKSPPGHAAGFRRGSSSAAPSSLSCSSQARSASSAPSLTASWSSCGSKRSFLPPSGKRASSWRSCRRSGNKFAAWPRSPRLPASSRGRIASPWERPLCPRAALRRRTPRPGLPVPALVPVPRALLPPLLLAEASLLAWARSCPSLPCASSPRASAGARPLGAPKG